MGTYIMLLQSESFVTGMTRSGGYAMQRNERTCIFSSRNKLHSL